VAIHPVECRAVVLKAVLRVAWLRIASAALIFALWRRPWRVWRVLDRRTRWLLGAWAAVLAVMNSLFYLAIDRLPLGTVAAIEFLPVVALAAIGTRTGRNLLALGLAVGGVYLLSDVRLVAEPLGFAFAAANAFLFALYIRRSAGSTAWRCRWPPSSPLVLVVAGVAVHREAPQPQS
jgi:inner membrane transporter RhtA